MANPTVPDGVTLSKRADETYQQFGDRLLAAHWLNQRLAAADPIDRASTDRIINRPALERLEIGSLAVEYAFTLCHAIMDRLEKLQGLHGPTGVHADGNTKAHLDIATNLCSLQLDKLIEGKKAVTEGERGWPTLDGHRL